MLERECFLEKSVISGCLGSDQ